MKFEKAHITYGRLLMMNDCSGVALTSEMEIDLVTPDHTLELATEANDLDRAIQTTAVQRQ
jgi:hypothetical protein